MFNSARLKLTAWYLLIIMCISIAFSVAIYHGLNREVERFERIQRFRIQYRLQQNQFFLFDDTHRLPPPSFFNNPELVAEIKQRVFFFLLGINGMIFVVAGALGYFLAGQTLKPIKEMVDEQNRFVSDASHELRTPLTSLKSAFEVYLRNKNQTIPEAKTLIQESIKEVNTLQSLSESLLQLTYYHGPDGHSQFKIIQLRDVINQAVRKIEPMVKQKHILIKKNSISISFPGNEYELTDCLVILLDNAIKYTAKGTKITIESKRIDHKISISVIDQGIGISEKDLPHIFNRFYRADSARTKKNSGGYGLGLAIAKKIVETHKGTLDVKSQLGKGSTFTIRLPIQQS